MKEILRNKKVIIVSLASLIVVFILLITLKDSYAYYGGSNELEIMKATIGKLKPTIDKVYIEAENKQYTNKTNPSVTITWSDDNITEYCVTLDSNCTEFTQLSDTDTSKKSVTVPITLNGEGNHTVYAYIKNKYGYTSLASSDTITLDTTLPTISTISSTEITETTITVSVSGSDANGISQYCYSTTDSNYTCTNSNTHTFNNLNSGQQYTFYFYLTDNAGNSGTPTKYKFITLSKSAKYIIDNSHSLESEAEFKARNEEIKSAGGEVKDDLRRFVGDYTTITDNFICFGTTDENTCKENMDTYMYRIIGVDNQNRLKLIKATKIVKDDANTFQWHNSNSTDTKWNESDLYKGLNGIDEKNYFIGNDKYNYMQQLTWTNLISPTTYYIEYSKDATSPNLFINERKENFVGGSIGLMYLSDYLYASDVNTNNWLFIQNGLNRTSANGNTASNQQAEMEYTMTRYGYKSNASTSYYGVWRVGDAGVVLYGRVAGSRAVRPVFYIDSSKIKLKGTGIITDPYYIINVN